MKKIFGVLIVVFVIIFFLSEVLLLGRYFFRRHPEIVTTVNTTVNDLLDDGDEAESESTPPVVRLTVNPDYDGVNDKFISTTGDDSNAVTQMRQERVFAYYNGGDVVTIRTTANSNPPTKTYIRTTKIKPTTDANTHKEIWSYSFTYSEDEILESIEIVSYDGDGAVIGEKEIHSAYKR